MKQKFPSLTKEVAGEMFSHYKQNHIQGQTGRQGQDRSDRMSPKEKRIASVFRMTDKEWQKAKKEAHDAITI
jgi:hypothetical protein